ncbi:MAG: N-acetyl-gamma-glutamyl-phosphate reductase [Defluviitaleaceae bacterium]|nr:N-acetyl-gamma-glutamyl-phosphate reductase [Defluviitaleaceae bacterium]
MDVFIDGSFGTTGLSIERRLLNIPGVNLIKPDEKLRKDKKIKLDLSNNADVVFLCLPDDAAREAAELIQNPDTVVIDASTAHRTSPDWAYGFPELSEKHAAAVSKFNRISVPGCHASGFCALIYPLVVNGLIGKEARLFCTSVTGYSGGGKKMIAEYESGNPSGGTVRAYSLGAPHKHLPEMTHVCGLQNPPLFLPVVTGVRQGMITSVPVEINANMVWECLQKHYSKTRTLKVMPFGEPSSLDLEGTAGDGMEIYVYGDEKQALMSARFDNLGKGSGGAAVQCMKIRKKITEDK